MEDYIQITKLNDFIFCPKSLYFHSLYEKYDERVYHDIPQVVGKIKHESIELQKYSSSSKYLQGMIVYSEKYRLLGKVDIYDKDLCLLIERKTKIKNIYQGYKYQLYAQALCLEEMGYRVLHLKVYSMNDNKSYVIPLPGPREIDKLLELIKQIRDYKVEDYINYFPDSQEKCEECIYKELCL